MATDIRLNDGDDENWITAETSVLNIKGSDLILDSASRRGARVGGFRRALVHDEGDGLTINFNNDYTGGVTINGLKIKLRVLAQSGAPKLPKDGEPGDLVAITQVFAAGGHPFGESMTLWICQGKDLTITAKWLQIPLGAAVLGSL